MTSATHSGRAAQRPLLGLLARPDRDPVNVGGRWRLFLVLTLVGGLLQHGGTMIASAAGGWMAGEAASGAAAGDLGSGLTVLVAAVIAAIAGTWMNVQFAHAFAFRYQAVLRLRVYDGLERSAPAHDRRTGDLAAAAMGDIDSLELFFAHLAMNVVFAALLATGAVIALAVIDPLIAAAAALGIVAAAAVPPILARRTAAGGQRLRESLAALNADVVDGVQGLRELVVFRRVGTWQRRLADRTAAHRAEQLAHGRVRGLQHAVTEGITAVTTVGVLIAAVSLAADGHISLAAATVAVALTAAALRPVLEAVAIAGELSPLRASARRVTELIDQPPRVIDAARTSPAVGAPAVHFDHVSFSYEPGHRVLDDLTFDVPAGHTVAIVGHSGAGKSTCANLLLRLWDVDAGTITVAEHDLREFPLPELRRLVTVIPQDVYLFASSVADNLRLGNPAASDVELVAAATAANAHQFIEAMPEGYATEIGERGSRLSGGQRQRLAIARALLSNAPVLVMDEAASNLDTENEREIQAAIGAARQGRTTLIIAHRLSTIRSADSIVVLRDGRVAEIGTHDELVAAGGPYSQLVAAQRDGFVVDDD